MPAPTAQPAPTSGGAGGGGADGGAAAEAAAAAARASALEVLKSYFAMLGMDFDAEIEGIIMQAIVDGYDIDDFATVLEPKIRNTESFKKRFPGYHARIANKFNALSIGEYLQLEDSYRQILKESGLPAGFWDDASDVGVWIANNVSVNELQTRVTLAVDLAKQVDPTMREIMAQFYGLSTGDVAAYFLDPKRGRDVIEHQYKSAGVATWAKRHGFEVTDMARYEDLSQRGVTAESAMQGYGTVRALTDSVGRIASIYGETFSQSDAESDVFFNTSDKRRRIVSQEQATFGGSSTGSTGAAQRSGY